MKIGLLQEGDSTGTTPYARYHEIIEEVSLADKMGFSAWGTSEQHFNPPGWTVSAPEVLYAAVAMRTERIILRPMSSVLLTWNHPIQVAERLAALDILSHGRTELCTARSNSISTMKVFGVDPATTRRIWAESMEILEKIFENPVVEHKGEFWEFPQTTITPTLVEGRFPKLVVATTSVESHVSAGERGIGVMNFDNYYGFDYIDECIAGYRGALKNTKTSSDRKNDYVGTYIATAFCAETTEKACEVADEQALWYFREAVKVMAPLAKKPGYEYMDKITTLVGKVDDPDWLRKNTPSVMIGTPDDYIERLKDLEARGIDEVLLRIDGFGHDNIMKSIELIGKEVIPAFN